MMQKLNIPTRKIATGLFTVAVGTGLTLAGGGPAHAEDPQPYEPPLSSLTVTPNPASTTGNFTVSGDGCLQKRQDGTLTGGIVYVKYIFPNGESVLPELLQADDNGGWSIEYGPAGIERDSMPAGTYTAKASCDTYTGLYEYPDRAFNVNETVTPAGATLDKTSVVAGGKLVLTVVGFEAFTTATVFLDSEAKTLTTAGPFDATGETAVDVTIPSGTALGKHTLIVKTDADSAGPRVEVTFTVVDGKSADKPAGKPAGTGKGKGGASGPKLANTGAETAGLSWLAGGLIATGGAALYAGRRRDQ